MSKTRYSITLGTATLLALSACTTPDFIDEDPRGRTKAGAVVGGVAGAIAGTQLAGDGNRTEGAIIGGISGALIGAAVGNTLDRQAAELRESLDSRVRIVNTGNELIVTMPNDILFAFDSADVGAELAGDLRALAASLQRYPGTIVEVVGHTDGAGPAAYNLRLSQDRAENVKSVLVGAGVASTRVVAIGRGEDVLPPGVSTIPERNAVRRRVEIFIRPQG